MAGVTIAAIAAELGVAKSTVSRALRDTDGISPATVALVRATADRLGYVPSAAAAGLSTGRHHMIGVVAPSITRWFYTWVLNGVDAALAEAGYDVMLFDLSRFGPASRLFERSLLGQRVDGLILLSTNFAPSEREQLALAGIPAIAIGAAAPGFRRIGVDDRRITREATRHLLELGHRRIALIGGVDVSALNHLGPPVRELGFCDALRSAGVPIREDWMVSGGYQTDLGRQAAAQLLGNPDDRPTGIVCACDEMAFGALIEIWSLGLRPGVDVSVVGIDGHELAEPFGLTTFAQHPERQGALAAAQLVAELEGAPRSRRLPSVAFELQVRTSSGPPA